MQNPTASLYGTVPGSDKMTYVVSRAYDHSCGFGGRRHESRGIDIFIRPGFTKISCGNGMEIIKTLGEVSHAEALKMLGYEFRIDPAELTKINDDELWAILFILDVSGDDTSALWAELERREG